MVILKSVNFWRRFEGYRTSSNIPEDSMLIKLDFKATQGLFRFEIDFLSIIKWQNLSWNWVFVTKTLSRIGKGNVTRNVPNSADFMASNKIYAVFHVFGCFKFKITFHNVFSFKWVLISRLIWNGFVEYQNRKKIYDDFW